MCFNLVTYTKVKNIFKLFISEFGVESINSDWGEGGL